MTENGLDIQTISTKKKNFQTDHFLLLEKVTKKKEEANSSHFIKFLNADPHCKDMVLPKKHTPPSQNQMNAIFANALV